MSTKLQNYALLAEIIGAIAVVVSLVYVGLGVRQNTAAVQVANHQVLVAMDMDKNSWLRDADFAATFVLAQNHLEQLSPVQLIQISTFVADTFNAWEFAYITFRNGAIEENIWNGWDAFYRSELEREPFRWFWRQNRSGFSPEYRAYVDAILLASGDA